MGLCNHGGGGGGRATGVGIRVCFAGMFLGYVSGVCFGYVSRHHELLYLRFRGYVTGYASGVCFGVCFAGVQPVCPWPGPPPKTQTHICLKQNGCYDSDSLKHL